jgi:hypothetical protein
LQGTSLQRHKDVSCCIYPPFHKIDLHGCRT